MVKPFLSERYMFFQLFSKIKVNLVAKITQSTYLCVTFHEKYKKLSFSRSFPIMTCQVLNKVLYGKASPPVFHSVGLPFY